MISVDDFHMFYMVVVLYVVVGGGIHTQLVPYHVLTDKEKNTERDRAKAVLRYLQNLGFRVVGYYLALKTLNRKLL